MIRTYLNGNGSLANIWMEIVVVDDICTHQLLNQSIEIEREIQCKYIAANRTEQNRTHDSIYAECIFHS